MIIVEETEPLGTGGAIANCRQYLSDGTFCVINGDLITGLKVEEMLEFHKDNGGIATISLWEVEDPSRFGVADYTQSNLINAGTYLLEHDIFDFMPEGTHSIERDVYEKIASTGVLNGFPFQGTFVDAGTPASFVEASQACISSNRFSSGSVQGDSWFGDGSHSLGAVSGSSIGSGVTIAEGCNVRNSVILEGASIGENCVLDNCLVGKGTTLSQGTNLQGEIVDHQA